MIFISGASSGIGESCARAFAAQGHDLLLIARRVEKLESVAREIAQTYGVKAHAFALDVRQRAKVEAFFKEQAELLSKVSVLVNNAGLARGLDPAQSANLDDWDAMVDTNVKGLLYVTRLMVPIFLSRKEGHIVNLGSVAGRWVYPKGNVYCATKRAVSALTEALRLDLCGSGIRVTEVSPGMVDETEFSRVRFHGDDSKARAVYANAVPLTASDIAEAVVWCVSRPKHVNIQELVIYPTDQAAPTMMHRKG